VTQLVEVIRAITPLAWLALVGVVRWRLFPTIRKVIESRSFAVKIAGIEVSVQEATQQIKSQLQDLQDQVIALRKISGQSEDNKPTPEYSRPSALSRS
jgi:hypothetical protein